MKTGTVRRWVSDYLGVDVRSLAFLRVSLALILLYDLCNRLRDLRAHYTDFGLLPRSTLLGQFSEEYFLSVHNMGGTTFSQAIVFGVALLCAVSMLVGFRTRVATFLSWFLLCSVHARNPLVLQAGDELLRMLVLFSAFLPLGICWSVDSAMNTSKDESPQRILSVGTAAILLQAMFVYVFTALLKSDPSWWPEGTAVRWALSLDFIVSPSGQWLLQYPELLAFFGKSTWLFEMFAPMLMMFPFFSSRIRALMFPMFWMLHIAFGLFLEVGLFWAISCASIIPFIPTRTWDWLSRRAASGATGLRTLWYDGPCAFCEKSVHILRTFLALKNVEVRPSTESNDIQEQMEKAASWVVEVESGERLVRGKAVLACLAGSPLRRIWLAVAFAGIVGVVHAFLTIVMVGVEWVSGDTLFIRDWGGYRLLIDGLVGLWVFVAWVRSPEAVADRVYGWVASRRRFGGLLLRVVRPRAVRWKASLLGQALALCLLFLVVAINLATLPNQKATPTSWNRVVHTFMLNQQWKMFSPVPKGGGWWVIDGRLTNGEHVNLFSRTLWHREEPLTYEKPALVSATLPSQRWRKYFEKQTNEERFRTHFAQYMCRLYNEDRVGDERLDTLDFVFMLQITTFDPAKMDYPGSGHEKAKETLLWRHWCLYLPQDHPQLLESAKTWLELADARQYRACFDATARTFQEAVKFEKWSSDVKNARRSFGTAQERKKLSGSNELRDGKTQYVTVHYETVFQTGKKAKETVTLMLTPEEDWRVTSYYIVSIP